MAGKQSGGEGSSTNIPRPKFYKIILSQHECRHLRIPKEFTSRYCKNMQTPAYLEVPSGEVWKVEMVHSEDQFWLAKGWQDFTNYYSIDCGYFLMIQYNDCSHFSVTIFDLSASEIEYPYNAVHGTRHAPTQDQIESDDSIEILEDIQQNHRGAKVVDITEHSAENISQCPLGQSSKSKRQEDSEDGVSVDMQDVDSQSFRKTSDRCRKHTQNSKICHDKNNAVMEKEESIAYQKAKAFKSNNPFIISFMQPSYVLPPFNLSISMKFARMHFLKNCGNLVLRVPGRGTWSAKCTAARADARINSGWKAFVLDNKLKFGDVCVFEAIKGTKLIDVTIFREAESTALHKIAGEVPGISDNSVPCSQSQTDHTKKLKQQRGNVYGFHSKIEEEYGEGTEIEHSVQILSHRPLGQGSKRKRLEEEEEEDDDDVSIDSCTKSIKVQSSQEDVASLSSTRKTKKSGESCQMHTQNSNISCNTNKPVMDKERAIAYRRAKAFKSENPFTISYMQPSYVLPPFNLSVSLKFAKKYILENCGDLVLRVPARGSWSVKCNIGTENAEIFWEAFVHDNKLKVGDVCVFEVIMGTKLIDVTIFPAAGNIPIHKKTEEVPGVSDISVLCSQCKMFFLPRK